MQYAKSPVNKQKSAVSKLSETSPGFNSFAALNCSTALGVGAYLSDRDVVSAFCRPLSL